jgi:hypothetical protein
MHILKPVAYVQTITVVPREYVYSSEDLELYFERVALDGGTLEGAACCQDAIEELDGVTLYLTNEQTNTTAVINPKVTEADGYMYLDSVYSVEEGVFYNIRLEYDSTDIYRGKVYCTSQTNLKQYTLNENDYVEEERRDNTFIVI